MKIMAEIKDIIINFATHTETKEKMVIYHRYDREEK